MTGNSAERQADRKLRLTIWLLFRMCSSSEPMQGFNVMLTIDIPLQLALEESLAKNIPEVKKEQLAIYEKNKDSKDYKEKLRISAK